MSAKASNRYAWPILGSAMLVIALMAWFATRFSDDPIDGGAGSVTVRPQPHVTTPAPVVTRAEPLLTPPVPPPLAGAIAADPDAFIGKWRTTDGQQLVVTAQGNGRYRVVLGDEEYDGVVKNGRVHFPRGIDGEWLQVTDKNDHCLHLGSGTAFCR